jgi:GntR family transcriptional regulator/MocR family aminotransferase
MDRASRPTFDEASERGLYRRPGETLRTALERTLRDAIREGSLRPGARLSSSRALAEQLGVSRGVVSDAYAELQAQGFVGTLPRQAPVVAAIRPAPSSPRSARSRPMSASAPPPPPRFDLTPTTPDVTLFNRRRWAQALTTALRSLPDAAFDYGDPEGDLELRAILGDELGRTRGVICDPEQVLITQGAAQALDLVLRVLRARGAGSITVEDPSLDRQHAQISALGLRINGQPTDADGLIVDDLRGDAVIVCPAHQFPTGAVLSPARRRALIDFSHRTGALIVEDDYDAEFRYDRAPVRALQGLAPDRVLYVGTTSKTLAPALRLGWLVAPPQLIQELRATKALLDDASPTLDQRALALLIEHGHYQRQVRRARGVYCARRDRLVSELKRALPELAITGAAAGLHLAIELPEGADDRAVRDAARERGVLVHSFSQYAVDGHTRPGLAIGYGRLHLDAIAPAVATLTPVLADHALESA